MKVKDSLTYEEKKNHLSSQINEYGNGDKIALNKTTSNLFRPKTKEKGDRKLNVTAFNKVIDVDVKNMVVHVEGMTSYEAIVEETLKFSCLPTVVPELKSITIGGAISGCGIESSSFRYGLVHETIQEMEVLLSDGTVVLCTRNNEYSDLFYGFPNTFGTLGYVLKAVVPVVPTKPYVKLRYHRYDNPESYFKALEGLCRKQRQNGSAAFIDGVIFSGKEMYLCEGQFVGEAPYTSNYRYMKIYYKSIREKDEDYLTTRDYIWRWDPDWFWCSKVFYLQNPVVRFLLGKAMLNSTIYGKIMHFFNRHPSLSKLLKSTTSTRESIIQDVAIPIERAPDFFEFFNTTIGITPIWICPTQAFNKDETFDFCPMDPKKLYVDFGFWDSVKSDKKNGYYNREIEKIAGALQGFKSLYSSCYYSQEEFWELYNHNKYLGIKKKYDPHGHLRDLYVKCTTK